MMMERSSPVKQPLGNKKEAYSEAPPPDSLWYKTINEKMKKGKTDEPPLVKYSGTKLQLSQRYLPDQ